MFELLRHFKKELCLCSFKRKWRKNNKHNQTHPNNVFPLCAVKVGNYTYGDLNIYSYRNKNEKLEIGNFCSIASDVIFVLSGEHALDHISTYPFAEKIYHESISAQCRGPILVEDDVWIGVRCTILSGVRIGQGSVIGANSIVVKDIPPYSVYVGNRIIKKRFDEAIIEKLIQIDFSKLTSKDFERLHECFAKIIDDKNINEIIKFFPRKQKGE